MWGWKPAKTRARGALRPPASSRSPGGRASSAVYDLAERVIPTARARCADADARPRRCASYALRAVERRGALTEAGDPRALAPRRADATRLQPHVDALVAEGRLREVEVDDGGAPFYVLPGAELDGAPGAAGARSARSTT